MNNIILVNIYMELRLCLQALVKLNLSTGLGKTKAVYGPSYTELV